MGAALVLLLVGLGALAAGVLTGRYYVPDDRQLRRAARQSRAYMRALAHLVARDRDAAIAELRAIVEENVEDPEPYFALGALFRGGGEHERAIRVHQSLAVRERERRKLRQRAMFELGLDFRAAGMPRRATRALEEVLQEEPDHAAAPRVLAALYEEQGRYREAATLWQRIGKRGGGDEPREHHLLVAAAQAALARGDLDSARQLLKAAQRRGESAHLHAAAAAVASARDDAAGALARLQQALIAEPGIAPQLVPALLAACAAHGAGEPAAGGAAPPAGEAAAAEAGARGPAGGPGADAAGALRAAAEGDGLRADAAGAARAAVKGDDPGADAPRSAGVAAGRPRAVTAAAGPAAVERALAVLAAVTAETGPRLELALLRAQLAPPEGPAAAAALARELAEHYPDALAARVAAAQLALAAGDPAAMRAALGALAGEDGAVAWALRGRWQCARCGHRPGAFSWRCASCRAWGSLRMETGVPPPPPPARERRATRRAVELDDAGDPGAAAPELPDAGRAPAAALPAPTLDPGLTEEQLARAGAQRSVLGRAGSWLAERWRRDRS